MDIIQNAKIPKGHERTGIGSSRVAHSRLEKCNIYFGGWPSGRQSVFLCVENSFPTHSMAGMVRQLLDIEFVQNVFFIHTVAKTQHEVAIRISFGIVKKRMKTETSGDLYMRVLSKKGGGEKAQMTIESNKLN